MKKHMKQLALFAIPHSLVMIFCLIMIFTGLASPFINGFAIDNEGKLYVGEGKTVHIFYQGLKVGKISMKSDAYSFVINSANELIVATPSTVYRMNTTGNILEKWEDPVSEAYQKMRNSGTVVTTHNGDEYRKISEFGWPRIIKNGTEEVYRLSNLSFIVKILLILCSISLFVNGAWLIHWCRKTRDGSV